jgi:hypothetical protein
MSEQPERRVADGSSPVGLSAAIHDAIEKKVPYDEPAGKRFNVEFWVETIGHNSPWHITYNAKVTPTDV